jgi:alpha-L-fucosidase
MKQLYTLLLLAFPSISAFSQAPSAIAPVPTSYQVEMQKMETYAFIHFGPNTFNDMEWGSGDAATSVFNPDTLDCEQWVKALQDGGMKGVILTAKHHDGFCLWPSKFTDYSIKYSPYRAGYGDAVGELESACKHLGLKFGLYLSPWDRHKASYASAGYVEYYKNQLKELLLSYHNLFELWFDGANGGSGYYGGANETRSIDKTTYYQFDTLFGYINALQPQVIIHSDGGPGNRWVGNENGEAGETDWCTLNDDHAKPAFTGTDYESVLGQGDEGGGHWVPAEADVSIRYGSDGSIKWFYHENDNSKSAATLVDTYYKSVGRNATMILNVPVNTHGKISDTDVANLKAFHEIIEKTFKTNLLKDATVSASNVRGTDFAAANVVSDDYDKYWATADGTTTGTLTFTFTTAQNINRFLLQEYIPLGQRVKAFKVEYSNNGSTWTDVNCGESTTTVGYKRLLRFNTVNAKQIRVRFTNARGPLCINQIGAYYYAE